MEGRLYRSGVMAGLNAHGIAELSRLNIRSIFDLRSASERVSHPTPWEALGVANYDHSHDDRLSGDLFALLKDSATSPQTIRTLMLQLYQALPFDHVESYRAIMLCIADAQLPLVFHCSAGKDRTGVLAALIMTLLEVAETDVMDDYLLTNEVANHRASVLFNRTREQDAAQVIEALLVPLLRADPDYLCAMFAAIEDRTGGTHRYFADILGLDERQIASIRSAMIAPESMER